LRLRPARRGVRLEGHGVVAQPAYARRPRANRLGCRRAPIADLLPRALHPELRGRVGGVPGHGDRRRAVAGPGSRRACTASHRARGAAIAARGAAGPGRCELMRVYVTGGTGFVGSNVAKLYADWHGLDVVAAGRSRPAGELRARFVPIDLLDPAGIRASIRDNEPELVVHAAIVNDLAAVYADRSLGRRAHLEA